MMTTLMIFYLNYRGDRRIFMVKFVEFFIVEQDIAEVTSERMPQYWQSIAITLWYHAISKLTNSYESDIERHVEIV